ncbi:MAG: hypothetical protein COV67_15130 [Nitrospinae bacterium CG11_big_fil_rev_8_21_14_0_20_56_8]|nr:MAG: hypothetical protein COV67_15130 [Nitrospinae bacterium CG11_big_fil_rev_8_21_14_0_20_56_8]
MTDDENRDQFPLLDEDSLAQQQAIKYAKEFSTLYRSEKKERLQLQEAHIKLQKYARELEGRNQDLEDFAFIASHDLQEPLRKIQAFGDRLQNIVNDLDPKSGEFLTRMLNAAERMQSNIDDLLKFSRVTRRTPVFVPMPLEEVLDDVLQDLEVLIQKQKGKVIHGTLPVIESDPVQIRQLFLNLISNGLKFHFPDVPPVVEIFVKKSISDYWDICFKDNGIGFDEKYLPLIFKPFERLHSRDKYEGSGMGLSICRKVVSSLGGEILAESKPGNGALFIIRIPTKATHGSDI